MPTIDRAASNMTAPTQFLEVGNEKYAYRRFGGGPAVPLLLLQHFTGTLDNWDPAVTDPLAEGREVILFESAGLGRSTGKVPETVPTRRPLRTELMSALDDPVRTAVWEQIQTKDSHMILKIEIERFSLVTSKQFDDVVKAINAEIGHPDMADFWRSTQRARSVAELESTVRNALGSADLMLFVTFDHGSIIQKDTGRDSPRIVRLVIGNPLIMREMAKRVPDAGSYAPVTVLVDERPDGVHLSYDRMASLLAPYGNPDALEVARNLDRKVEDLLERAGV
jgi:uncharacterized protein (DUF302 family)